MGDDSNEYAIAATFIVEYKYRFASNGMISRISFALSALTQNSQSSTIENGSPFVFTVRRSGCFSRPVVNITFIKNKLLISSPSVHFIFFYSAYIDGTPLP